MNRTGETQSQSTQILILLNSLSVFSITKPNLWNPINASKHGLEFAIKYVCRLDGVTEIGRYQRYFEAGIKSLDRNGKPNKPDVSLYKHHLRANSMMKASAYLLDLVAQMEDFNIPPNTASFNFVLKAMHEAREIEAAEKLFHG